MRFRDTRMQHSIDSTAATRWIQAQRGERAQAIDNDGALR